MNNKTRTTPLISNQQSQDWENWIEMARHDNSPKFELNYNGSPIFIDMKTLLQCLKIAEYTHHVPPIDSAWWLKIVKQYPIEVHLDGRIQTKSD
ncbi:TPA: hypothetical protein ACGTRQ_003612 [Vibrio parahaemolyticus]